MFANESSYLKSNNQDFHNQLQSLHNTQICNLAASMYPCHTNRTNLTSFCWTKGWCKHSWTLWLSRCVERSADCIHQPNIIRKHFMGSHRQKSNFRFQILSYQNNQNKSLTILEHSKCFHVDFAIFSTNKLAAITNIYLKLDFKKNPSLLKISII